MTSSAFDAVALDYLAAMAGFSVREVDKTKVSALLDPSREIVARRANVLPIDSPPALFFDPR